MSKIYLYTPECSPGAVSRLTEVQWASSGAVVTHGYTAPAPWETCGHQHAAYPRAWECRVQSWPQSEESQYTYWLTCVDHRRDQDDVFRRTRFKQMSGYSPSVRGKVVSMNSFWTFVRVGGLWILELETKAIQRFANISQSRSRTLLGPSPGWKRLLATQLS